MNNLVVKIINNQNFPEETVLEEVLLAESRMNDRSKVRFHIETVDWKERVEQVFKNRCIEQRVKWASSQYYKAQIGFFGGACAAMNEIPAYWGVCLMSGRTIIEEYKL